MYMLNTFSFFFHFTDSKKCNRIARCKFLLEYFEKIYLFLIKNIVYKTYIKTFRYVLNQKEKSRFDLRHIIELWERRIYTHLCV